MIELMCSIDNFEYKELSCIPIGNFRKLALRLNNVKSASDRLQIG